MDSSRARYKIPNLLNRTLQEIRCLAPTMVPTKLSGFSDEIAREIIPSSSLSETTQNKYIAPCRRR
jgi:hypothetical protein